MPPKFFYKKQTAVIKKQRTEDINPNAKYLIIVESPSKCTKIESFLGIEYCCIASKGHIRTIDGLKSIDTKESFEPKFSIIEEKANHIHSMRSVISKFSKENIILASDDDREGEAIAWHICEVFNLPIHTTKRILFHEITKNAICEAVKKPTLINMNLVKAQHARQVLDILVGYKISPFLWKYLYHNKANSLSAGRCQTPALRLVYDNENEKKDIETKYKTIGNFSSRDINFELNHEFDNKEEVLEFLEKSKSFNHKLNICTPKETKKSPPKPFNTSQLLQSASNLLHLSPKETMSLCQTLYQAGYITYMRTDSQKYSTDFLNKAKKLILDNYEKAEYIGNIDVLENKDINNPHEAIRITNIDVKIINDDNARLNSLYKLIWKNTIESCMSDAKYKNTTIQLDAPMDKKYEYVIEIPLFLGWKILSEKKDVENQNTPSAILFYFKTLETSMKSNKEFTYNHIDSNVVVKNKRHHYTEASLINKLEDLGIGRPSTFASIIETIQERGYVKKMDLEGEKINCLDFQLMDKTILKIKKEKIFGNEKKKLVLQSIGLVTVEFLVQHFNSLFEYDYTKKMEDDLDLISSGKNENWADICKNCFNGINELSKPVAKLEKQVYHLDEKTDFVFEKYGAVIRSKLDDNTFEYRAVKKDVRIDLDKLKNGEYDVEELYEIKNNCLGKFDNIDVYIKNGKFGPYIEWGDKKESIRKIEKPLDKITLDDVMIFLKKEETDVVDKNILRKLNDVFSIRKGKFGSYVYYKTNVMKKPEFFNINKFKENALTCDANLLIEWLFSTYNIK